MALLEVKLPELHQGQLAAFRTRGRYLAIRAGRRWGKTTFLNALTADRAAKGRSIGWFVPEAKFRIEPYDQIADLLSAVRVRSSKTEGLYYTRNGGKIDFWSLENELAGRGRKYHLVIVDEAAFTKENMIDLWERNIEPTLLDYQGECIVASNTNGVDPTNFLYAICNDKRFGFVSYHAPTTDNPTIPVRRPGESEIDYELRRQEIFDKLKRDTPPLVYQQEYLAEFVDWSGVAFFALEKMLVADPEGGKAQPAEYPAICDTVFATIDTATKTGTEHDGTGVIYWALSRHLGHPLTVLDYDITQIEGALLEAWLPNVFLRLEDLANQCGARYGSTGAHIEDKASGMVLLQQARTRGWPAHAIDSKLTSVGKSERAISVSGYVFRGDVKISRFAYDKLVNYKGSTRNHLLAQVTGFRVGDKDMVDDDLLDDFTYGVAIGIGNEEGF